MLNVFSKRSDQTELMDDLSLNNDDLRTNLNELEVLNRWVGSKKLLIGALEKVYHNYNHRFEKQKIVIADLCCGSGDLLRTMNDWATTKQLSIELMGIDANPFMIQFASEKSDKSILGTPIQYKVLDIFSSEFKQLRFDIVTINSSCHHFNDTLLLQLFNQLKKQTRLAIIINDLHRHWISYFSIKWLSKLLHFSYLAQHDAPLSVMRAFRKNELIHLFHLAQIHSYEIHWRLLFRWEMIIWLEDE
jgi:ubiquinone/menaquinone biosynthesis C-methylase UbiE